MDAETIPQNRLYGDLAYLWPLVSPPEDYAEEATCWQKLLFELLGPERHRVLELGVGGGHNLSHLAPELDGTAVDISPQMLKHSISLNPGFEHIVGDMRCIRLGRTYDAVLVHDAISYMTTLRDLSAVFTTAAAHLHSGGPLILAPDDFADTISLPRIECESPSQGDLDLRYVMYSHDPDPIDTSIETIFTFFIMERGRLSVEFDRHITGLFPRSAWRRLMHTAGFEYAERRFHLPQAGIDYTLLMGTLR